MDTVFIKGMPFQDTVPTKGVFYKDTVPTKDMVFQDTVPTKGKSLKPWEEHQHQYLNLVSPPLPNGIE